MAVCFCKSQTEARVDLFQLLIFLVIQTLMNAQMATMTVT